MILLFLFKINVCVLELFYEKNLFFIIKRKLCGKFFKECVDGGVKICFVVL